MGRSVLLIEGNWKVDAKYGRQFCAETWEEVMPATIYGIEKYLGSGLIKGVGPQFAKRIVAKFGTDTISVIEDAPDRLLEVYGIGKKRVDKIKESWEKQKEIKNIMLFLQSNGGAYGRMSACWHKRLLPDLHLQTCGMPHESHQ